RRRGHGGVRREAPGIAFGRRDAAGRHRARPRAPARARAPRRAHGQPRRRERLRGAGLPRAGREALRRRGPHGDALGGGSGASRPGAPPRPWPTGERAMKIGSLEASVIAMILRGTLTANRVRLALTVLCIALGVALAGAVHTVHTSALAEIDRSTRALAGAADLAVRGPRSGFPETLFARIARMPDVRVASPIVEVEAPVAGAQGTSLRVLGIDPMRAARL